MKLPGSLFPLLFAALSIPASLAQKAAPPADPYRDEPLVFERLDTAIRMHADGTGETTVHIVVRVQSEGAARQFSVLTFPYASANETGTIDFVRVHKADGTTVETPTADAMEMPSEVTRDAPMYSDIREKHLPVRSLLPGDRLDYQVHTTRTKAEAPGQFWGAEHFVAQGGIMLQQTLSLSVPAGTYVQVWSPKHPAKRSTRDGLEVWEWTSSQTRPSQRDASGKMTAADVKDPDEDDDGRKLPSVAWTTFHSWAEVGDWYRGLALGRAEPTDAIRAKAADLTKNAKTPDEQVQALYRYVATQTRYISISLGVGRFQPHAASEVMANQYGDCKDKDTLLESLLKAKGFTTAPALIGAGIVPVPEVPTPAVFNHVITTVNLASGTIWLDTTAEVAPFRVLVPVIRDQNALVVPASGPASLVKTPADPPFPYLDTFDSVTTLDTKGVLKGHIEMNSRSDNELGFRLMLQRLAPSQWDDAMQYVSNAMNFAGKVSNANLRQNDPAGPVHLSYDYLREDFGDWKNNRIYANLPALEVTVLDKEKAPEHDIDLGAPRTLQAHSVITLPAGDRAELPESVHVKRDYATYDKTYRLADGKLVVDRTVAVKQHKLAKAQWKDYLAFQKAIGMDDGEPYIVLIAPSGSSKQALSSHPDLTVQAVAPHALNMSALKLLQEAESAEKRNDWDGARKDLDEAFKIDPQTPYLMSMLGWLAIRDHKPDEAIADLKAELREHPDANSGIVMLLVNTYVQQKRFDDALALLQSYSDRKDKLIPSALARVQLQKGDQEAAFQATQKFAADYPDDRAVQSEAANLFYETHHFPEATTAAKKAMDGSDDPGLINNNVYVLSEMKVDLPYAETQSRRSIDLLEKRTAEYALDQANSKAFADSSNLTASWDTLAYILLLQGKAKDAEPYFQASWFNRQDIAVGNHLAQTYEALGRKGDALRLNRLALSTEGAVNSKEDYAQVKANIARLEKDGVKPGSGDTIPSSLQAMRTYQLKKPAGAQGGGTVRVQVGTTGITAAMLVTGDGSLKPVVYDAQHLPIHNAVPPGSSARVLRDAVLYCGKASPTCDFVFMTNSGITREGASE